MSQVRKYANLNLPDLDDSAPDVYETPELTEDASTLQTSTVRSRSPSPSNDASEDERSGVDRHGFDQTQARSRFRPARVDARNVDFSDRINPQHHSYRTSHRKRRGTGAGSEEELGDFSDEEQETKDQKLARLRREVAQLKEEIEQEKEQQQEIGEQKVDDTDNANKEDPLANITRLSDMLDAVYVQRNGLTKGAESHFHATVQKYTTLPPTQSAPEQSEQSQPTVRSPAPNQQQQAYILSQAASFDARLSSLETSLGFNSITMPDVGTSPPALPILQSLDQLHRQFGSIASTTPATLDAHGRKVRELIADAEKLDALRKTHSSEIASNDARRRGGAGTPTTEFAGRMAAVEDPERVAKVNALHSALETIDKLSPTLPLVLERLRTLRLIHATAGTASSTLESLEKRQAEQAAELRQWRESLEKVEQRLGEGEKVTQENVKTVGEWVRKIEERVAKFS